MDSDLHHPSHHHQPQHQHQQNMIKSGMYRDEDITSIFNPPISRFMSIGDDDDDDNLSSHPNLGQTRGNESHFMNSKKQQQMMYQNLPQSQEIVHNNNSIVVSSSSPMVDRLMATAPATNLLRQSSSAAGFFNHVNIDNGYSIMRSMDEFRPINGSVPDSSFSPRLKNPMAFSSGSHSSSGLLSSIPIGYDSSILTDGFMKELGETDHISSCESQNEGENHGPTGLTHQLSLPTSSTELSAMENQLQFQDNMPLRSRAKRGCATHPRSIAERVRRTKISERMKKLQDLVPNMDKQTSIADMLDLAVDYIKNLQKQVETLADHSAKCRCPNKKKL